MLANGDRVAVGISGGKDSMALLYTMLSKWSLQFEIFPLPWTWFCMDYSYTEICEREGASYHIDQTQIEKLFLTFVRSPIPVPYVLTCEGVFHGAAEVDAVV